MNQAFVSLRVLSDTMSPASLEAALSMCGDRTWAKGARRGATQLVEKENGWELVSSLSAEHTLEEHINSLMQRSDVLVIPLKRIGSAVGVQVSCAVYGEVCPPINLPSTTVERLAALGSSLDIDVYVLSDNDDNSTTSNV